MKKRILTLVLVVALLVSLVACSATSTATSASASATSTAAASVETSSAASASAASASAGTSQKGKTIHVGFVLLNFTNSFYAQMMEAGKKAAVDNGFEIDYKSCDNNLETEISLIEDFIQSKADVVVADPIDNKALVDVFQKGAKAGVPCVGLFNKIDTDPSYGKTYNALLDHENIFEGMCYALAAKMDGTGNIGFLAGTKGNSASDLRRKGLETMLADYPNMKVIADQDTDFDPSKATSIFQTWLTANPNMNAVVSVFDDAIPSVAKLIDSTGKSGKILIASNDGAQDVLKMVQSGQVVADAMINGYRMGYWTAMYAYNIAIGKASSTDEYAPVYTVVPGDLQAKMKAAGHFDKYKIITPDVALGYVQNYQQEMANIKY
jgi:ABC-type sugar transport system, periplasmic component